MLQARDLPTPDTLHRFAQRYPDADVSAVTGSLTLLRTATELSQALDAFLEHPAPGRSGRLTDTRELGLHPNYILVHDVAGDTVRILRVLHASRQWPEAVKQAAEKKRRMLL